VLPVFPRIPASLASLSLVSAECASPASTMFHNRDRDSVRESAIQFADSAVVAHGTPLYQRLLRIIASSDELLDICLLAPKGSPPHFGLLAATHYVLLECVDHSSHGAVDWPPFARELASFFPALASTAAAAGAAGGAGSPSSSSASELDSLFRNFCLHPENRRRLEELVANHTIQTNEVRRATVLLPAFLEVFRTATQRHQELDMVEVDPPSPPSPMQSRNPWWSSLRVLTTTIMLDRSIVWLQRRSSDMLGLVLVPISRRRHGVRERARGLLAIARRVRLFAPVHRSSPAFARVRDPRIDP